MNNISISSLPSLLFSTTLMKISELKQFGEMKAKNNCQYCLKECVSHRHRDEKSAWREVNATVGVFYCQSIDFIEFIAEPMWPRDVMEVLHFKVQVSAITHIWNLSPEGKTVESSIRYTCADNLSQRNMELDIRQKNKSLIFLSEKCQFYFHDM